MDKINNGFVKLSSDTSNSVPKQLGIEEERFIDLISFVQKLNLQPNSVARNIQIIANHEDYSVNEKCLLLYLLGTLNNMEFFKHLLRKKF